MKPRLTCCLFAAMATVLAQPVIRPGNGVLNSASYLSPGLPASGIAQGSIFVIFGSGLGPAQIVQADKLPFPAILAETAATVTVGGTSKPALVVYTLASQVAAILPSSVPAGSGTITVTYQGSTSAPVPIEVVPSAFGVYTFGASGSGQAIATDPILYVKNTVIHTFHPGDLVVLWGTGLGAIQGDDGKDSPAGNIGDVQTYMGSTAVDTIYHGRGGSPGLDQVQFRVPAGVDGCSVPVGVRAGGAISNITTIAVSQPGQSTCTDSVMGQDLMTKLASGQKVDFGYIRLESGTRIGDAAYASFSEFTPASAGLAEYGVSAGYCAAIDCSHGCVMQGTPSDMSSGQLDAGALTLDGQGRMIPLPGFAGSYGANLNPGGASRILWPQFQYTVSGQGGARVLPFTATKAFASTGSQFTNLRETQSVPVKNDFAVAWDASQFKVKDGTVSINGVSFSDGFSLAVLFQCTAPVSAGQFTIPSWVLSALPPSGIQNGSPLGFIWIGQYAPPVAFNATGLDKGLFTDITFFLRSLKFE